ncbi:hypothetical protein [uncultured Lactococcus sp.]|uniref:hypothetical protein n=1 Tax=uncultured Lactococcus sp. TaxID=167973 RepID=UPI002599ED2E|nr:hypothetical protein [uncultured Lactococcus sp.]
MSELEKAKQIAAEAFNFKSTAYTTIEQQNEIIEVNRKAFMQILSLSSLTIPKSIAEMLNFIFDNHFDFNDDVSWVIANIYFLPTDEDYYNFDGWINLSVDNHNLALAYLAGKALGVDLVKVVEG